MASHHEWVTRSVVILGFDGVQAMDIVEPYDVFTGATLQLAAEQMARDFPDKPTQLRATAALLGDRALKRVRSRHR